MKVKLSELRKMIREELQLSLIKHLSEEKTTLKAPKEKHNPIYVQDEPVSLKKLIDGPDVDEEPKAEKDQKDVLDRNEKQAKISATGNIDGDC